MAASADRPLGNPRFVGLLKRTASAVVLGPIAVGAFWFGFPWIDLLVAIAAPFALAECWRLTRGRPAARTVGLIYVAAAMVGLLWLRHQPAYGRETVLWLLLCVIATDIGGYFVGSWIGGARLAPRISPGKTWSGLFGAMAAAGLASAAVALWLEAGDPVALALLGALFAAVGQAGDLLESHAKRRAGVKDSGRLIPGHGGILDRIDGLVAVVVAACAIRLLADPGWPWS
ncbi:MAG: phosphatidate cytidylyltransferase [Alphaproteobacteria bacterium]|nr:phosphatidate cytidylyltransferase [Alphaproteobacteria bacterium]